MSIRFMFFFCFACFTLGWADLFAQYEEQWAFGHYAGLDFRKMPPAPFRSEQYAHEGNASVCDAKGNLLFYTNGITVWDSTHKVMANGDSLKPDAGAISWSTSASQGALIVPVPRSRNRYYIFTVTGFEYRFKNPVSEVGKLYYSIVDMSLNNGLGAIEMGNKAVLIDSGMSEQMTSVSGNECDVWMLCISQKGVFKAYHITPSGLSLRPVLSEAPGTVVDPDIVPFDEQIIGCMNISPDRRLMAIARNGSISSHRMVLYDFDPSDGKISHERILDSSLYYYSIAFSEDNSKMYVLKWNEAGSPAQIHQFGLEQRSGPAIVGSRQVLYETKDRYPSCIKRGPDNKLYVGVGDAVDVIQYPNLRGSASQYTANAIRLVEGTTAGGGLPNVVSMGNRGLDTYRTVAHVAVCFRDSVALEAGDEMGEGYVWSTGKPGKTLSVGATGVYWVRYKIFCDTYIDTFHVDIFNPILLKSSSCQDQQTGKAALQLRGKTDAPYRAVWTTEQGDTLSTADSVTHMAAGNYLLYLNTTRGCDTLIRFMLGVESYSVDFAMSDSIVCTGAPVRFLNQSHDHFTKFDWQFGDGDTAHSPVPDHRYSSPGAYTVQLTGWGPVCSSRVERTVFVDAPLEGLKLQADRKEICAGEAVVFHADLSDSTVMAILWTIDGVRTRSAVPVLSRGFDFPGRSPVLLTAYTRACPELTVSDTIIVHGLPFIDLGPDSVLCLGSGMLTVGSKTPEGKMYSYQWNTGAVSAYIRIRQEGTYTLKVTDTVGCYAEEHVRVDKSCYNDIPNAFTPNGDGMNDYFYPRGLLSSGMQEFRMRIWNQWGQVIFETNQLSGRGWDGRYNGQLQPEGVYIYHINLTLTGNIKEQYTGNVTLMR